MTRDEAINILNMVEAHGLADEAKRIAIKALEHPERNVVAVVPCGDTISRQAVDEYIAKLLSGYLYDEERTRLEELSAYLWELPSVKPQYTDDEIQKMQEMEQAEIQKAYELGKPKTGHWIKAKPWMIDNTSYKWECSECEKSERFRHNFCPNCGCRMVEPKESENCN